MSVSIKKDGFVYDVWLTENGGSRFVGYIRLKPDVKFYAESLEIGWFDLQNLVNILQKLEKEKP